ncbi:MULTISPECIES: type II toxin-antitoxin system HipA family toxin [unclassified Myroides]|uniref:type II toxin-antitoxin system HipA family toxin n=1 Tax=unclassified Myroides TaxID=2642485 RepID=UPI0015FE4DC2|nr:MULTISPECIES: type II toxin-antitoxin system HipA family toxin [unclassified Myroides]MBB1150885.1 type II toxin-antitoxin system HipA family toxin [Myroides sp. NP-2]MDM1407835.1 type II toxin-antitoxin system HipA family toxin [Myroides sp. DF42-4-2]
MVTTAFVRLYGQLVGAVAWDAQRGIASFEYDPKFNLEQFPIAPLKMPTKNRIYSFPEFRDSETFKGLPGLLADALPDRYGKELINAWLARQGRPDNSLNPVELLCFIGKRGMGALSFEPTLIKEVPSYDIELTALIETTKLLLEKKENISIQTQANMEDVMMDVLKMGTSAGGARPKAIIAYNEKTGQIKSGQALVDSDFEHWIIKFDEVSDVQFGESKGYGRVEMAYYKMATDFGIEMMESRLIEENNRVHFMTKRFDRIKGNQKIHSQTLCAIQHYDFANITSYSYEQVFQTMRQLRLSYAEAEQMFKRMIFNVIARNCDDHTKNFSFLMTQEGKWKLAPAYDICFAYRPDSVWVSQHNLSINGKRKDFKRADLIAIAEQNSIRNPAQLIDNCLTLVQQWPSYAQAYQVEEEKIRNIDQWLIKTMA